MSTGVGNGRAQRVRDLTAEALSHVEMRQRLRFHGCSTEYCGNYAPALAWADDYLGAYFTFDQGEGSGPVVAGLVDPDLHRAMLAMLEGAQGRPSRTHTSSVTGSGPRWAWRRSRYFRLGANLSMHVLTETGGITISDHASETFAFITSGPDDDARFEPVRMVRELFTRQLERNGYVVLHAGAVALDDGAVLICGPRGAGKTTLICGLLEHEGARFISNVRTFVRLDARGAADVAAWPWSVRVGLGTCSASNALRSWLESRQTFVHPQKEWDAAGSFEAAVARHGGRPAEGGVIEAKVELTAAELATIMGTDVETGSPVTSLVFPELMSNTSSSGVQDVDPPEAAEHLKRQRAKVVTDVHTDWLGLGLESRRADVPSADQRLTQLAAAYPAVRLRIGDARDAARAVAALAVAA